MDLKIIILVILEDLVVEEVIMDLVEVETQGAIVLQRDMLEDLVEHLQTTLVVVVGVLVTLETEMLVVQEQLVMEVMDYLTI